MYKALILRFFSAVTLLFPMFVSAQSAIVRWPLTVDYTSVTYNSNDIDNAFYTPGPGINEELISVNNLGGDWWNFTSDPAIDPADYVQFQVSPKTGANAKNIYITALELELRQIPWNGFAGPRNYRIDYSKTSDFSVAFTASAGVINTSFNIEDVQFLSPLEVFSGETIYFRIYGYNSDNLGDMIIRNNDFTIRGYVEAVSGVNPVPALSFEQDCGNTGNLIFDLPAGFNFSNHTIVIFAKAGSPITLGQSTALLSSYTVVDNDLSTFGGSPYQHDANARLVFRGKTPGPAQLINLTPGLTYYFLAFNFLNNGGPGFISAGTFAVGSVSGTLPEVENYTGIGSSESVKLKFTAPNCVDAVMIVAKTASVNGIPSGDGSAYIADPDFSGSGTPFDGGKVVYNSAHSSGSPGAETIVGLTNKTVYYFKSFVRKGTSWSPGLEITVTPDISSVVFTQEQSEGLDFFEFMTLERMDISNLNLTDQGVCANDVVYRSLTEWEAENFFNSGGNSDITTPLTDIPAGTFVHVYSGNHTVDLDYSDGLIVLRNSNLDLDQNGDQVLVYTDPLPGPFSDCYTTPNKIQAAIDFASTTGYISSGTPNDNTSYRPGTPAAFETLNAKNNSRFRRNVNPKGDSSLIFTALMTTANWKHKNTNTDWWELKKIQFHRSDYNSGNIVFNNVTGNSFEIDAGGLSYLETSRSTRYMVLVNEGANPDAPARRYTCYQPDTDYQLAPDVVKSITQQFPQSEPCGVTQTTGAGKVVYFDYNLPTALTITGLKCATEYRVFVYAINGNGATMNHGSRKRGITTTTENALVQDTYYSRQSGNFSDNIWATSPTGTPGIYPDLQPCLKLIIQSGNTVTLDVNASVGEIEVEAGGTFILNGMTLSLQKNFLIDGTVTSNGDSVIFNGTAGIQVLQTASETEFFNIEVNKTSLSQANDLSITGNIAIGNTVAITAGNLTVNPGFSLRLISDQADRAAALTAVPASSTVSGNFIVERFLPAITTEAPPGSGAGVGWRYLSAPVLGATFEIWDDDFVTTGLLNSDYPEYPHDINPALYYFPNLQFYNETIDGLRDVGFDGDPNGAVPNIRVRRDITQAIQQGQGVFAYLGPVPLTIDAEGQPYTGALNVPLGYTNHGLPAEDGWHLVANPYPCAIDWKLVTRTAGVSAMAYIYNATGTGNYVIIDANAPGPQLIASANAFWVKTDQAGSITFEEAHKSDDVTANFYKTNDPEWDELFVFLENTADTSLRDQTQIRLNENASAAYDFEYDAYKWYSLNPFVPGVSTQIDTIGRDFSINTLGLGDSTFVIPLKANIRVEGDYRFTFDISGERFLNYCLVLHDNLTDAEVAIESGKEYVFSSAINNVEDSARFSIILTPTLRFETYDAVCFGGSNGEVEINIINEELINYEILDADGETFEAGIGQGEFIVDGLPWGFYELIVSGYSGACPIIKREFFIGQPAAVPGAEVSAYNALCDDSNNGEIYIGWQDSSFYQLSLFNENQLIDYIADASIEYSFPDLQQGNYNLNISNACDTVVYALEISSSDSMVLDFIQPEDTIYLQEGGEMFYQNISEYGMDYQWGFSPDQESPISSFNGEYTYTIPGNYDIVLSGKSAAGCFKYVDKPIVVIDLATSVNAMHNTKDHFGIAYGPHQIKLNYQLETAAAIDLAVYDGLGKVYFRESLSAEKQGDYLIPSGELAPGIYFIRINRIGKPVVMLRFVVRD